MPPRAAEIMNPAVPAAVDVVFAIAWLVPIGALLWLFVGALVSIHRRAAAMTGLEELGWYAFVVIAQFVGPLVWFLWGRDRYDRGRGLAAAASARQGDQAEGAR